MAAPRQIINVTTAATSITLTGVGRYIKGKNLQGSGRVTFRFDGTTAVADAENCFALASVAGDRICIEAPKTGAVTISAIASVASVCAFWLSDHPEN